MELLYKKSNQLAIIHKKILVGWDTEFNAEKDRVIVHSFSFFNKNNELENHLWNVEGRKVGLTELIDYISNLLEIDEEKRKDLDLYLISHFNTAEISTIDNFFHDLKEKKKIINLGDKEYLKDNEIIEFGKVASYTFFTEKYKKVKIIDTFNYQKTKLEDIGEVLNLPKINFQYEVEKLIPGYQEKAIENYEELLHNSITRNLCINYALRDAEIVLKFVLLLSYLVYMEIGKFKIFETAPSASEFIYINKFLKNSNKEIQEQNYNQLGYIKKEYINKQGKKTSIFSLFPDFKNAGEKTYQGGRNQTYFNGIVNQLTLDLDITGAYPLALKLAPSILLNKNDKNKEYDYQMINYTLLEYINYLNTLNSIELLQQLGYFSGEIFYKENIKSTPTLINIDNSLAECNEDNSSHTLLELVYLIKIVPHLVDWEKTKIIHIARVNTDYSNFIFREYIDYCTLQRAKHPKKTVFNNLWKLIANSFYGKLVQGINGEIRKNIITEKDEKLPNSQIFNPVYGAYITALVRLLTNETILSFDDNDRENFPINIVTDGILFTTNFIPDNEQEVFKEADKWINKFNNLPFNKAVRKALNLDSIWELKHYAKSTIIPGVRKDWAKEIYPFQTNYIKIAKPSAYSFNGDKLMIMNELTDLYINKYDIQLPNKRLSSFKDVKENNYIVQMIKTNKTINWNIQTTKRIEMSIDNEKFKGVFLIPFKSENDVIKGFNRNLKIINKNKYRAIDDEGIKKLEGILNKKGDIRLRIDKGYSWIVNDLIHYYYSQKIPFKLTYKNLIPELKEFINENTFKTIKQRLKGYKIEVKMIKLKKDYFKYFKLQNEYLKNKKLI